MIKNFVVENEKKNLRLISDDLWFYNHARSITQHIP